MILPRSRLVDVWIGCSPPTGSCRLLETILMIAFCAKRADDRTFLIDYAHALKRQSDTQLPLERDRVHATARFAQALRALKPNLNSGVKKIVL